MNMFTKITASNPQFEQIKSQLASASDRFDYNALAREYNSLAQGELVSFPYTKGKLAVLAKQLEKRGLKRDADFTVQGSEVEGGAYTAFVSRVSEKEAGILAPAPRQPRAPKEGDAKGGAAKGGKGKGGK